MALECLPHFLRAHHLTGLLENLTLDLTFWNFETHPKDKLHKCISMFTRVVYFIKDPEAWRKQRNENFVSIESVISAEFFATLLEGRLNAQQIQACITDDERLQVVAGAGTGKTATLYAKAAYMVERLKVPANGILAITYSKKSARDLEKRFASRTSLANVKISTIHSLGYEIVAGASGRKPSLAPWIDDLETFARRIDSYVRLGFSNPEIAEHLTNVLLFNSREIQPP